MCIEEAKFLGGFISAVRASGFWASGGLGPSKIAFGRAGGRPLAISSIQNALSSEMLLKQCALVTFLARTRSIMSGAKTFLTRWSTQALDRTWGQAQMIKVGVMLVCGAC